MEPNTVSCNLLALKTLQRGADSVISSLLCLPGEGFHNYHHTFPFDYSASEFGLNFNPTTWFIDFMCWLGLATDRKRATKQMIEARKARTGDGSAWLWTLHLRPLSTTSRFMAFVTTLLLFIGSWEGAQAGQRTESTQFGDFFPWSQNNVKIQTINEKNFLKVSVTTL